MVEATFKLDQALAAWLAEQEIELLDDSSVVCSRELTGWGSLRSRSRVNGAGQSAGDDGLRDHMVEITAQGQTVQVGQPAQVREWLDLCGSAHTAAESGCQ